jgi:hypothetical protein
MCQLKSFSFLVSGNENYVFPEQNTSGIATDLNWKYKSSNSPSSFVVQGFKNINVFKIEAVGNVYSEQNTFMSIVSDWAFFLRIYGTNAPIIGNVLGSPNGFAMTTEYQNPLIAFSRYNPSVEFTTPIVSVGTLELTRLIAQGVGANPGPDLNIAWHITFVVHYTFEGEEFAFL